MTYFPEYFSTCPTEIVYTRGTQSHRCHKRASCSYVISVSEELPLLTGYDSIAWCGVNSGIVNNSGTKRGVFNAARDNISGNLGGQYSSSTTTPRGVAFDSSKGNSVYNGEHVIPNSMKVVFIVKY